MLNSHPRNPDFSSSTASTNLALSIFLISVLGLFLEMMLIRWIATEIRIFAYLQNTILVVSFLGIGLGCFTCNRKIDLRKTLLHLLFLILFLAIPVSRKGLANISLLLSVMRDFPIFYSAVTTSTFQSVSYALLGLILSYGLLLLVLDMFVPVGRILGRLLDNHPDPIWAYSVNIMGSLIRTWLFLIVSSLYAPPFIWVVLIALLLIYFLYELGQIGMINFSMCLVMVILSWFAGKEFDSIEVIWSPYQKLAIRGARSE